ncbi:hypothetical protein AND_007961 [Anopheles darlingi]|uniref:UDP-glucuronosyltransferase n=1 Tax=Anopheles darlingi TaxID=43151 RepID=W5J7J3_ANODA|nr:hypothetical protein AND_007961 [Anopheles darlingi]
MAARILIVTGLLAASCCSASDILMITMGGTKSHKIPFLELAKGLIPRGHNVTFLNGFPADFTFNGLQEVTPSGLVEYIRNYTNWDLLGARMRGDLPLSVWDVFRFPWQICDATLEDKETLDLLGRKFDLVILDGAFPECALGLVYRLGVPFMYINTVGFYTGTMSLAGNPTPYSTTPIFYRPLTDDMSFIERLSNTIACIHCKTASPLPKDLEDFIAGSGESGFIYVSMGSSVKAANMPDHLRKLLVQTFARLPYRVLWKYEASPALLTDLPENVKIGRWLPQQDILGHRKLRAFITHGGLLSMFETVFHGVPVVTMPVFCDHDSNAAKAVADGYALKLDLETLTSERLVKAIHKVIHDPKYRKAANNRRYYKIVFNASIVFAREYVGERFLTPV